MLFQKLGASSGKAYFLGPIRWQCLRKRTWNTPTLLESIEQAKPFGKQVVSQVTRPYGFLHAKFSVIDLKSANYNLWAKSGLFCTGHKPRKDEWADVRSPGHLNFSWVSRVRGRAKGRDRVSWAVAVAYQWFPFWWASISQWLPLAQWSANLPATSTEAR